MQQLAKVEGTDHQIMPTGSKRSSSLMAPPSLPYSLGDKAKKQKVVLDEDSYVNSLGVIIERDYFPELSKRKAQLEVLEKNQHIDFVTLSKIYKELFIDRDSYINHGLYDDVPDLNIKNLSVDDFFREYISEDNYSFEELQKQSMIEHRKKFHWVYENSDRLLMDGSNDQQKKAGMLMLYYIGNKVLTHEERNKMDSILNRSSSYGSSINDQRPNTVGNAKFRVRNQLMFPPELEDSEDTCLMHDHHESRGGSHRSALPTIMNDDTLALENGKEVRLLTSYASSSSNSGVKQEKIIQRNNTSLPTGSLLNQFGNGMNNWYTSALTPLERPHTPSQFSSNSSDSGRLLGGDASMGTRSNGRTGEKKYEFVRMTPTPMSAVNMTPLRAGDAESEPEGGPRFSMQPVRTRELVGRALDKSAKVKAQKSRHGKIESSSSVASMSAASTPRSIRSTTPSATSLKDRFSKLTPAAQALAMKINRKDK